ncbi:hypothetical protein, variant 2 [Aphanomyces astaci]|uniref:Uncharacterized protein n=1 Tax=Aphanomyces astaci TaxID=112090 RepID=W4FLQ1_APHAT|nr:hypothetical protein, variant 1 [Aphanomyces astaci]XP_009842036.1 hypothetical protein, variant 2 [Aphanomyces astaci]ETV68410.1 hypothetical protein, variant 1 [Aphanomyces astaci]ETV68411.1 hypothetical protein, variant 2 [Aphanomyces astaci]|eukprot:XP_009842035.1 hypothetical protein, variant 1 [Aphanomyces astaci]
MPTWVKQMATEEWTSSVRKAIKVRRPPGVAHVLPSSNYGIEVTTQGTTHPVTAIEFGYIDSKDSSINHKKKNGACVRGRDATETVSVSNQSMSSTISSVFCLDASHPFTFTIDRPTTNDPQAMIQVRVGLSTELLASLPMGVLETWMIVLCETPPSLEKMSVFDFSTHTFCIGVRLRLAHVHARDVRAMTVHAPSFVPHSLRSIFNLPLPTWTLPRKLLPLHASLTTLVEDTVPRYMPRPTPPRSPRAFFLMQQRLNDIQSYVPFFTLLLEMEEVRMTKDMHSYDQYSVRFRVHHDHSSGRSPPHALLEYMKVTLDVPGAIEGRPVLLQGGSVRLRASGGLLSQVEIHGVVLEVKGTVVTLLVPCTVHSADVASVLPPHLFNPFVAQQLYASESFHVRFTFPRYGLRLAYDALANLTSSTMAILHPDAFPATNLFRPRVRLHDMMPFNDQVNDRQLQAVWHIVNKSSGLAPYIIFGPPGTGKTITVIESILQVLKHNPNARVLAVAPSDAAADILGMRLRAFLNKASLFRFNWPHRKIASVPGPLLGFCHVEKGKDVFSLPDLARLLDFRVVVTTTSLSGVLKFAQVPVGHFSHCIVDEACQATEPETLVALTLCDRNTHVTLAGDPMQLGPSCRAKSSCQFRLVESFQERLMRMPMYDCATADNAMRIVKLVNNYRSHSALIALSSTLFYHNELLPCADPRLVDSMCQWEGLQGRHQFPMMFYAVNGVQHQSIESSSFCNLMEAIKVADVIGNLLRTTGVSTKDIAVITPYRQQVVKLRQLLRARGHGAVNVGTVHNFQGQESKICILSTVMTSMDTISSCDYVKAERPIPVLSDYKSFNVALTRAQALCIVVGHPAVLSRHALWRYMMGYCVRHGGYQGTDEADDDDVDVFNVTPPSVKFGAISDEPLDDPEWHLFM